MFTNKHIWDYGNQTFISTFESDTVSDSHGYAQIPLLQGAYESCFPFSGVENL